jgi:hypothetical protein
MLDFNSIPCGRCARTASDRVLTSRTNGQGNQARNADETHRVEKDFETLTGWTDGGPGTVRAERDVVGCRSVRACGRRKT